MTSIYFPSGQDPPDIPLFVKLHCLVPKNACEMKVCLFLHVTSDELSQVNRDVKLWGEKGVQLKCWMSGLCCLILAHFLSSDDSASQGEEWLCSSCESCIVILSTHQGVKFFFPKQLKLVWHLTLNPACVLPAVYVFLLQCGRIEYTKTWTSLFPDALGEKKKNTQQKNTPAKN